MSRRIVVLGSVNTDLVVRCERFPSPGQTVNGRDFRSLPGGKGARKNQATGTELGNEPAGQLFDLSKDPGETKNLHAARPDLVKELKALLEQSKSSGRSRSVSTP